MVAEELIGGDGFYPEGSQHLLREVAHIEGDDDFGLGNDGCCQNMPIAWITAQRIRQAFGRLHQGLREGPIHCCQKPARLLLIGAPIGQEVAHRVFQNLARPVDAIQMLVSGFQQQVPQLIGVEHTAVEQNREDRGFQPEAHFTSTWSSWPSSLSSSRAPRRTWWRCSRSCSTA